MGWIRLAGVILVERFRSIANMVKAMALTNAYFKNRSMKCVSIFPAWKSGSSRMRS